MRDDGYVGLGLHRPCGALVRYFHGGAPGLRPGDIIEPTSGTAHLVDGCPTCEARRRGEPLDTEQRLTDGYEAHRYCATGSDAFVTFATAGVR